MQGPPDQPTTTYVWFGGAAEPNVRACHVSYGGAHRPFIRSKPSRNGNPSNINARAAR